MSSIGLPVPPGFTITTEACTEYGKRGHTVPAEVWQQTLDALGAVERARGC